MSFIMRILSSHAGSSPNRNVPLASVYQIREYAARKGTREKARKKKVKVEEKKIGFIPHNQRGLEKMLLSRPTRKFDDSWKQISTDNVYPARYYRWRVFPFVEAVEGHRETHHPTMYNCPNAPLNIIIELNMEGEKKTKFMDNFHRVAPIPHPFDHGDERQILVFTKDAAIQQEAKSAGAALTGGVDLIKEIQSGAINLQDFHFVIAHPHILPELVSLRGLMKRKFPNPKNGTLNVDILGMVKKYLHGVTYSAIKDEHEHDFGMIQCSIGTLSMDPRHLEENFASLVQDVYSAKPKRPGTFISRCLLVSPPSSEKLKVDHTLYTGEKKLTEENEDDVEDAIEHRSTG